MIVIFTVIFQRPVPAVSIHGVICSGERSTGLGNDGLQKLPGVPPHGQNHLHLYTHAATINNLRVRICQ